ncbi:non-ribosomal peptide synthetase [Micromonospora robiginosa]|uniref:Amino acid adenylation domain-containing protein n=1 Tax=Micromonospora robiginosa TaxID=2749844 RepID=A0A7L6B429_9ACTN|nr:non-ribosomal peptide synthetase [Micromonospora ferruginea]QLQ36672.1 amino acid adenylation domain-containing protein [Micromonospora ferruginea]
MRPELARRPLSDTVAASFAQERFWFVDQLRPDSALHNLAFGVDVDGPLDEGALAAALHEVVRRHELLRTRFAVVDGALCLGPVDPVGPRLVARDVPAARLDELTRAAADKPFDYRAGPLLRMLLLRRSPSRHRLVLVAHHAVFDGWSFGVFLAELAELYAAHRQDRPARLPGLALQYRDYAAWQREAFAAGAFDEDLAYWAGQLAGDPPPPPLPADFPRPSRPLLRGATHRFQLPASDVRALRTLAAEEQATEFMAYLVVLQALLWRRGGQTEPRVGSPTAGRSDERLDALIGPFINVVVLRGDLSGDPTLRQLLGRARAATTGALAHQHAPLQHVVERTAARRAPYHVALAVQNFRAPPLDLGEGLRISAFPVDVDAAQHDLSVFVTPSADGAQCMLQYDTAVLRPDTVVALATDFAELVRRLARDPDLPLARLARPEPSPGRFARDAPFPLATAQRRWHAAELARPGDPAAKIVRVVELRPARPAAQVRTAVERLARRHEMLRVGIAPDGRTQSLRPDGGPELRVASTAGDGDPIRGAVERARAAVPHLDRCGVEVTLVEPAGRSVLVIAAHRAVVDDDGVDRLCRDLAADDPATEPEDRWELAPGHLDWALWCRRRAARRDEAAEALWSHRHAAAAEPLVLAGRAPATAADTATRDVRVRLDAAATARLDAVCAAAAVSRRTGLLTVLGLLLARHTGRTETWIGVEVAPPGAPDPHIEVGTRAELLPVPVEAGDAGLPEVLTAVEAALAEARAHAGSEATPAAARIVFRHRPAVPADPATGGVGVDVTGAAEAELTVTARDAADGVDLVFAFRAQQFEPDAAEQLAGRFAALLDRLCATPDRPVRRAAVVVGAERAALLRAGDRLAATGPDATLHGRFATHAAADPERIALLHGARAVRYGELDRWSNQIGHALVRLGVPSGGVVAVVAENGPLAVAALLGVLKAGAAFACLDPAQPPARLDAVLRRTAPAAVLMDRAAAARHGGSATVVLDDGGASEREPVPEPWRGPVLDTGSEPATAPGRTVTPNDLAYLAFTSGSTGRPKAIPHAHRDLAQFAQWQSTAFDVGPGARMGQLAPMPFDVAYCEIFGALCHGATLCLRPAGGHGDPVALAAWLARDRVSVLQVIPALFREMLAAAGPLPELRTVLFVGEALHTELVRRARHRLGPAVRLVNVYGPTEVVAATYQVVTDLPDTAVVPIGHPIDGRQVVVLDPAGELCPPGATGEVCVHSSYLAPGYRGDEAQTAQRFVTGVLPEVPGVLYRTGDLARLRPGDLALEFAGRLDNQVKISGIRLELEEVEAAVARHPDVRQCVAAVRGGSGPYDPGRLVAYVVTDDGAAPADLRDVLRDSVPTHMVPADVVALPALPRTANGKIDRAALPDPPTRPDTGAAHVAPRTFLERQLAGLVAQVLGVERVGVHDDFFALGGNSLQAARLVNRAREALGLELSLQSLLTEPTVAAAAAAADRTGGYEAEVARLERELRELPPEQLRALLARHQAGGVPAEPREP